MYCKGLVIVTWERAFFSVVAYGASHCNQWGRCDALFCNLFEDLLYRPNEHRMKEVVTN